VAARKRSEKLDGEQAAKASILASVAEMRIFDPDIARELIRERQQRGIDAYDEVWDGVYVMPSVPSLAHQKLVHTLEVSLDAVVVQPGKGEVYPGANVSDRPTGWKENFRVPDVVVVLTGGRAVDRDTYLYGGPDFLVEIQTPGDATDAKIPFYSAIQVRELLIVHRDTRVLRLYRHDGKELTRVEPSDFEGKKWLVSDVVPLAFRRTTQRGAPRTEVQRTDGTPGQWTM
jgi:Uma2 family endonuclease